MSAETDVRFVHFWRFHPGAQPHLAEHIYVVKNHCAIEWKLRIIAQEETLFGIRRDAPTGFQLLLEPALRTLSIRTPKLRECSFHMVVKKITGEVVQGPHVYTTNRNLEGEDLSIRPPLLSQFHSALQTAMTPHPDTFMELTTTFVVPSSAFEMGSWPQAAPPPQINEFPFRIVENKKKHNVKIICQGGVYTANRAALFQCSAYFRRLFNERKEDIEFNEDVSIQAAEIVFTFMLTASFALPSLMSPSLMNDIISLLRRFSVLAPKELEQALEREACVQLEKEEMLLEKVLQWMIVGNEHEMKRLENMALAILFMHHSNNVMAEYTGNPSGNAERREIFERLHARRSLFNTPPINRFIESKKKVLQPFEFVSA